MLRKNYDNAIIGLNYVSLTYGLVSLYNGKTTLIIDESNLQFANKWYLNIGYVERAILKGIGDKFSIDCLSHIDNYLNEQSTILCLNEKLLELSNSPYANIKEIARKLPEAFSEFYTKQLIKIDPEAFDKAYFAFLDRVSEKSFELFGGKNLDEIFDTTDQGELDNVFKTFLSFLDEDKQITKQLHYILQVMFQSVFSSAKNDLESKYLLISLISPRFEVDAKGLQEDLLFEYRKDGGDLKAATINDWGVKDNALEYILMNAIDGIVEVNKTYFFGQPNHKLPFKSDFGKTKFLSIDIECVIDHDFIHFFKNKRIVFSSESRMGSDFPYWEVTVDLDGNLTGVYSFADHLGTKPSFYYPHALDDIFKSLELMLPGFVKVDWVSRAKLKQGKDIWFEYGPERKTELHPHSKLKLDRFKGAQSGKGIEDFYQCGPNRGKSLGFYSYLLDIFST